MEREYESTSVNCLFCIMNSCKIYSAFTISFIVIAVVNFIFNM